MQKSRFVFVGILFLSLFLMNLASAQLYGSFSLGSLLNGVDDSTIVLGLMFVIFFVLINFSLDKFFKGNKSVSGAIAFSVSLLMIWGINRSGISYTNIFYNFFFFIPSGMLETLWPLVIIGAIIILSIKYGFLKGIGLVFIFSGAIMIFLSFTNLVYETSGALGFGALLIILGAGFLAWSAKKEKKNKFEISY